MDGPRPDHAHIHADWAPPRVDWALLPVDWALQTADWALQTADWALQTVDWALQTVDWACPHFGSSQFLTCRSLTTLPIVRRTTAARPPHGITQIDDSPTSELHRLPPSGDTS
ncbi:hypothetical protein [Gordonia sputi]|uniref:Uncharacterized protein n=1 Tax=Gordonia sputi NBRC 100414 TaxID=1089453 RepID=H5U159_9ACTN|nr:hypothetical protein [Gordonia sputi]NKY95723.1 hypothetical protein [Gordonia sputi]GAB39467.1 hypothetical protein GOSPT_065_00840 [Gordonia sputi NBRC 100414]